MTRRPGHVVLRPARARCDVGFHLSPMTHCNRQRNVDLWSWACENGSAEGDLRRQAKLSMLSQLRAGIDVACAVTGERSGGAEAHADAHPHVWIAAMRGFTRITSTRAFLHSQGRSVISARIWRNGAAKFENRALRVSDDVLGSATRVDLARQDAPQARMAAINPPTPKIRITHFMS